MHKRKLIRKYGFKIDQEGIINRYFREDGGWNEHLQNTKEFIVQNAIKKDKKIAVVLGSGWLLDVPIEELSKDFNQVILVDISHPRQITHKVKKLPNVTIFQTDITGLAEPIYETLRIRKSKIKLSEIKPEYNEQLIQYLRKADYVVSVNLLNQLDILLCDYIAKSNQYNAIEIDLLRKQIQANHLQLLPISKSALITDYEELNLNEEDKIVKKKKLVYVNLPNESSASKWKWNFDQKKTYHHNFRTIFKVKAVEF